MPRPSPGLVIDARPRGPRGPLAGELIQGRPVLAHLLEQAWAASESGSATVVIHARLEEHRRLEALLGAASTGGRVRFATGSPPEGAAVLRADRLYDATRIRRALRRDRDLESAVVWRLDLPHGLTGAEAELTRRQSYQPLGRYWALAPSRRLAVALRPTRVTPNLVTSASAVLMVAAAGGMALSPSGLAARVATAALLAIALVLDTADGHLARLQGSATEFGRWLDGTLDEMADMVLHAGIAWGAFTRDGQPAWLVAGMAYAMGKYLFVVASTPIAGGSRTIPAGGPHASAAGPPLPRPSPAETGGSWAARLVRFAGHADVRWHLWIVLAACGRLDVALASYAVYFPARAVACGLRKGVRHA